MCTTCYVQVVRTCILLQNYNCCVIVCTCAHVCECTGGQFFKHFCCTTTTLLGPEQQTRRSFVGSARIRQSQRLQHRLLSQAVLVLHQFKITNFHSNLSLISVVVPIHCRMIQHHSESPLPVRLGLASTLPRS